MAGERSHWRDRLVQFGESVVLIVGAAWVMLSPALLAVPARWAGSAPATRRRIIGIAALVLGLFYAWTWRDVPRHWLAWMSGERPLYAAKSWHYQLDKVDVDQLAKTKGDVVVTDFASQGGKVPLTAAEVERLKTGPDGRRRFVISYMSIGEAEQYRFYYQPEWKTQPPSWLGPVNCAWPGAHKVRFWQDAWKDIVWRGDGAYLKRIIAAGFDGVYLDRVDIYDMFPERASAREDMITFITEMSAAAKRNKPGFLILPQNADDLLSEPQYRAAIDGLGREDLLFGASQTGTRNPEPEIKSHQRQLDYLLWEWKPVFAVEYLQQPAAIEAASREMRSRGLIPTIQPRALDGNDPTAPVDLATNVGTAEYISSKCPKGEAW